MPKALNMKIIKYDVRIGKIKSKEVSFSHENIERWQTSRQ